MPDRNSPRLTSRVAARDFRPGDGSAYIFAGGPEERAGHVDVWRGSARVLLVEVQSQSEAGFSALIEGRTRSVQLRSAGQLADLLRGVPHRVYLDITGLSHSTWAPLLRAALTLGKDLLCVYVEPGDYTRTATPTEGPIYDLSERIQGIAPLPGFATLTESDEAEYVFVPLLGFEGTRLIHVTEHVEPQEDTTIPIVGVPGFRPEYPFVTYRGNRKALFDGRYWTNVRYATANCPFDTFFVLRAILRESGRRYARVAPIGTKPHGLGAVLFALSAEQRVELIYDHPIRNAGRTHGSARLCLYEVGTFARSGEFSWTS